MKDINGISFNITNDNFIVRDHHVHHVPILPGVTYIDIVYRVFKEYLDADKMELKNILFHSPLATSPEFDCKVDLVINPIPNGYKVRISSRKIKDEVLLTEETVLNAECEVFLCDEMESRPSIDIQKLIADSFRVIDMDEVYGFARKIDIHHREFMKTLGEVYYGTDTVLMKLTLSDLAKDYLPAFYLHPAYLDGATFALSVKNLDTEDAKPSIPFSIKRFHAVRQVKNYCYVLIKNEEIGKGSADIKFSDVQLYNEHGEFVAEFERLSAKRIRSASLIKDLLVEKEKTAKKTAPLNPVSESAPLVDATDTKAVIENNIKNKIALALNVSPGGLDITTGFYDLGLESSHLLAIVNAFEEEIGEKLYPTLLFEYSNIKELAGYLLENHASAFEENSTLSMTKAPVIANRPSSKTGEVSYFEPVWKPKTSQQSSPIQTKTFVLKNEEADYATVLNTWLRQHELPQQFILLTDPNDKPVSADFIFSQLLSFTKALMELKQGAKFTLNYFYHIQDDLSTLYSASLGAFANTLKAENPNYLLKVIGTDGEMNYEKIVLNEITESAQEVRYLNGIRHVKEMEPVEFGDITSSRFREAGVYLITGGAGGLGLIFAKYLCEKYHSRVILSGRSVLNTERKQGLASIKGGSIEYIQTDITNKLQVQKAVKHCIEQYGELNGIIHAAGVVKDEYIIKKERATALEVFAPKITGTLLLDECTKDLSLDFFFFCSSASAVIGNPGQVDYAYANSFMDHFASYRNNLVARGERRGITSSVNWPYWEEGGMRIDEYKLSFINKQFGALPLPTKAGIDALEKILNSIKPQVLTKYQQIVEEVTDSARDLFEIAIIGMDGKYPGAENLQEFWNNLQEEKDCITDIPADRWPADDYYDRDENAEGKYYSKSGGFIKNPDHFDPLFFSISPAQAKIIDPQERLLLESTWNMFEDAGYTRSILNDKQKVGVFVGVFHNDYTWVCAGENAMGESNLGKSSNFSMANRLSYTFNLSGPSLAIDTACSSSLTALAMACESIYRGESEMAIAGGVNLILHPQHMIWLSGSRLLSKNGKCAVYGAGADGYIPGEGVGTLLLKPLKQAEKDGDHIHAVIKSWNVNHNQKGNGFLVPNPKAQVELIQGALNKASIPAESISYIETSSVGTELGDTIEFSTLQKIIKKGENNKPICKIGSVKSYIGHLEAASGMAAVSKVVWQLKNKSILSSTNVEELNPNLDFENSAIKLQKGKSHWEQPVVGDVTYPRRAGVNSFGAGGANAHVLLEEYVDKREEKNRKGSYVFILSAKTAEQVQEYAGKLVDYLEGVQQDPAADFSLARLAYTMQEGRERMSVKASFVAGTLTEAQEKFCVIAAGTILNETKSLNDWGNGIEVKLSIPTYPFDKQSYWINQETAFIEKKIVRKSMQKPAVAEHTKDGLSLQVKNSLLQIISLILEVDKRQIDTKEDLSVYGFDSITFTRLINDINGLYKTNLTPVILFEHSNLESFIAYLVDKQTDKLKAYYPLEGISISSDIEEPKELAETINVKVKTILSSSIQTPRIAPQRKEEAPIPAPPPKQYAVQIPALQLEPNEGKQFSEPIAIIGMNGRMPESPDLAKFWENLLGNKDLISEIPADRWVSQSGVQWGGLLQDIDKFDAQFFNISPREAQLMDPQQRIFLESVWHCIEDAGYSPKSLSGSKTGVFVGVSSNDYARLMDKNLQTQAYSSTGSSHSIVANRVSFLLNFHGPSEPINTACSSALVAIHRAVTSIRSGDSELAIAGGVNALFSPELFTAFGNAGMLSPDGRCKTFDSKANGYVRSEGVGTLLLKSLRKAEADGDYIYGVIKGSAENHGGHVNSLTVPNPTAQAAVLVDTYLKAGISPERVTYIEAHGTGTSLGDPIEIHGLKKAFEELSGHYGKELAPNSIGIGAVKSNVGHLEAAAGMAGIFKLLLSLKHKTLPASIHLENQNSYIDLSGSPFYFVDKNRPWEARKDNLGMVIPRIAGISSFGFGGSNAHIALEEYTNIKKQADVVMPAVIVLSAKNEERLKKYAGALADFFGKEALQLQDVAYTLQFGREAMDFRVAFVANNMKEVLEIFKKFSEGRENLIVGETKKNKKSDLLLDGKAGEAYLKVVFEEGDIEKIAQLWIQGVEIDWDLLYTTRPQRVSLPPYPFERKRHWLETASVDTSSYGASVQLHPLLRENTSTIFEQKFKIVLDANKYYLADHIIGDKKILAGVASLEMALQATEKASNKKIKVLENINWLQPVLLQEGNLELEAVLIPTANGVEFSLKKGNENIFSQCHVSFSTKNSSFNAVDVARIKADSSRQYSGPACYEAFAQRGFAYGRSFQVIQHMWSTEKESLSLLKLPAIQENEFNQYILHPSLLDGALQTVTGVSPDSKDVLVPFAIERMELASPLIQECYAYVKVREGIAGAQITADIQILGLDGTVLVDISGFSLRMLLSEKADELLVYTPEWKHQAAESEKPANQNILLLGEAGTLATCLNKEGHHTTIKAAGCDYQSLLFELKSANQYPDLVIYQSKEEEQLFEDLLALSKGLIAHNNGSITQLIHLSAGGLYESAASGLLKTLCLESSKIIARTILIDSQPERWIAAEIGELFTGEVRYLIGEREIKTNRLTSAPAVVNDTRFRDGGVYLITGGAGGLGLIFAKHLLQKNGIKVVLTGRSLPDDRVEKELKELGQNAVYIRADITNKEQVNELIALTLNKFGKLNGIIHAAGIIRDSIITKKTIEDARQVIAPKIKGTILLDEATTHMNLDFILLCSSLSAITGNIGQADYAFANNFMDAFAMQRKGKVVSVNWPLWAEGRMNVDAQVISWMKKRYGMAALSTDNGVTALELSLAQSAANIGILEGNVDRLIHYFNQFTLTKKIKSIENSAALTSQLQQKLENDLKEAVSNVLKIDVQDIDVEEDMSGFGFDSITFTEFTNELNKRFELVLSPTVLFEYKTLVSFTDYLVKIHSAELQKYYKVSTALKQEVEKQETPFTDNSTSYRIKEQVQPALTKSYANYQQEPVAIIGMNGRMPMSADLNTFWNNLVENKDLISRIPADRWISENGIQWGGLIEDIDKFDASFFSISPREAELMDPQQRIFLESVWQCIEDAGYSPKNLSGTKTGVFAGVGTSDYGQLMSEDNKKQAHAPTGLSHSILANRVSYLLDLHGPSEPIDTACSSSLVAIHRAVKAIQTGDCDLAIAGGVNALLTSQLYSSFGNAGMLSADGRCKTFDSKANGYVRGEGVGTVFLKPLSKAEADGDHIYGTIRGSGENHGGHVNSLTVPNPTAQAALLVDVYKNAGISPARIGYIETHGTGTPLGDPIEINALKKAFAELSEQTGQNTKPNSIGIGAVKSNVGHLETAAGMAGIFKLLLSMKHKTLPANIHLENLNPHIHLEGSPFYIVDKNREWEAAKDSKGNVLPRIAGVSSFGFGGSNAHIVIEEYINTKQEVTRDSSVIIVLSAKTEERLKIYASTLCDFIARENLSLDDMAYTLQVGRESMDYRLAFEANSVQEVIEKLREVAGGKTVSVHSGQGSQRKMTKLLLKGKAGANYVKNCIEENDLSNIAQLWVEGVEFDWSLFYKEATPNRISLPPYPFEKVRHWLAASETKEKGGIGQLHPLVHQNTSTLFKQELKSFLSNKSYYFTDHVLMGEPILPGVVSLEMLRFAGGLAAEQEVRIIEDIKWVRPILGKAEKTEVTIHLEPNIDEITYSINNTNGLPYTTGKIHLGELPAIGKALDISALENSMDTELSSAEVYKAIGEKGLQIGEALQVIQSFKYKGTEVFSRLRLPSRFDFETEQFAMHPSITDGIMQTAILGRSLAQLAANKNSSSLFIPFSVDRLEIYAPLKKESLVYSKFNVETDQSTIQVTDVDGNILLNIHGFVAREYNLPSNTNELLQYKEIWKQDKLVIESSTPKHLAIIDDTTDLSNNLELLGHKTHHVSHQHIDELQSLDVPIVVINNLNSGPQQVFSFLLKLAQLLSKKEIQDHLQVIWIGNSKNNLILPAVSAFLRTLSKESPKIWSSVLQTEGKEKGLAEQLNGEFQLPKTGHIRYSNEVREILDFEINDIQTGKEKTSLFQTNGVYLITGGTGGIGAIVADYLAKEYKANLILTGRSGLDDARQQLIAGLEINAASVKYIQTDVSNEQAVQELIEDIKTKHPKLNGILHTAGNLNDQLLRGKKEEESIPVLSPKIEGVLALDKASVGLELDIFLLFSSIVASTGNIGQADYAFGNAFMDAFARQRNATAPGKTIAINWPLWENGGMKINDASKELLKTNQGLVPLPTAQALLALEAGLASTENMGVLYGKKSTISKYLNSQNKHLKASKGVETGVNKDGLRRKIESDLTQFVVKTLKLKSNSFDKSQNFGALGFDSITFTEFATLVGKHFNVEMNPTTFYEYDTVPALTNYFLEECMSEVQALYGVEGIGSSIKEIETVEVVPVIEKQKFRSLGSSDHRSETKKVGDVAIIGMDGRMPDSSDLDVFWSNIMDNKLLISVIPPERWVSEKGVQYGGLISDVDKFDSHFFNISPREAQLMDPQQRIFLESVWKCIEDAGYAPKSLSGSNTAIYVGIGTNDYTSLMDKGATEQAYASTGSAHSLVANRVSYLLNFHGPSEPVDTACSSSLVAIHKAVRAIQIGDSELAIAGGVNTLLAPQVYSSFGNAGMLSPDGRCKTFDSKADGYVRGEGVGTVLLKSLSKAIEDGDHIYGIIKSSAENHGGRVNSLTVPNPNAQAALLIDAYSKAGISPDTIGYIETHGTGTPLGDPIEVNALKKAFAELSGKSGKQIKPNSIGIGTVKTNVGHLETAAGMAGMFKVLLSLKHKAIPANINFETQNPYINLEKSPFYIVKENTKWEAIRDDKENNLPRIAGISSFGFGGANAHIVVQEYIEKTKTVLPTSPALIVLSAKTEGRLKAYSGNLAKFLEKENPLLSEFAFTLQLGRDAMDFRLAFVANSMEEVREKLKAFSEGEEVILSGNSKKHDPASSLQGGESDEVNLQKLLKASDLDKLAVLWVQGAEIAWSSLYATRPHRISLPTYPFERKRHWLETTSLDIKSNGNLKQIHPLLTENISTIFEQKFKVVLESDNYYLSDHVIAGKKLLVGVASLEMALQAGQRASAQSIRFIENINWIQPVSVQEGNHELELSLIPAEKGMAFSLKGKDETVFSQGFVSFETQTESARNIDLDRIKSSSVIQLNGVDCYQTFAKHGFAYGKSFQTIQHIWSSEKEVLSLLKLPVLQEKDFDQYVLHPSLLDGALQSVIGLQTDSTDILVPFGIERLELLNPLTKDCYAYIKLREDNRDGQKIVDIQISDSEAKVLVNIHGFSIRVMQAEKGDEVLVYSPEWKLQAVEGNNKANQTILLLAENARLAKAMSEKGHLVTVKPAQISYNEVLLDLKAKNSYPTVVVYQPLTEENPFDDILSLSKALLEQSKGAVTQLIYLSRGSMYDSAISGLLKTLCQESSKIIARSVQADAPSEMWMDEEIRDLLTGEVRYVNGKREIKINSLEPIIFPEKGETVFRQSGVYLITGGAGGLGLVFAKYLKEQYAAKLVLVGRSVLKEAKTKELDLLGADVVYVQADITNKSQVKELIAAVESKFGQLNGVLHAAGIIRDSVITKKENQEAALVLAPKIQGTLLLDQATAHLNLDFFLLCSSLAATTGNSGQADYAFANSFMDAFALKRKGKTVSINWPLWTDGGMQVDAQVLEWMKMRFGMAALSTRNGLAVLEYSLLQDSSNIGVVEGKANRLIHYFNQLSTPKKLKSTENAGEVNLLLKQKLEGDLKEQVSKILKIDVQDIDAEEDMSGFGFDSITFTEFTNQLNKNLQISLSPAVLFEYKTLASFVGYLTGNHLTELQKYYKITTSKTEVLEEEEMPVASKKSGFRIQANHAVLSPVLLNLKQKIDQSETRSFTEPIAIIGMNGRMPMSADLNTFWTNLLENKNLISQIPAERWVTENGTLWGGLIDDIDKFDAAFFNISPYEAELMDPQQRIFLESVWQCIEDAGYAPKSLSGTKTGVFVGVGSSDYGQLMNEDVKRKAHAPTGIAHSILANRVSYLLDIHGPSEPIDTACSSALVAIHRAVRAIQAGDCDMAIAGGVNALLSSQLYAAFGDAGMLSADGSCKTFDSRANGYVRSEGVGAIFLKPLNKAQADGDHIYAVIRGSAENHGGHVNSLTVPNPTAQSALLVDAYKKAGISPETVGYIETHGTGTSLGDPIEINALKKAFGELAEQAGKKIRFNSIGIGAVKSNVGHLETAAGMAGMFKLLLSLKHKTLPANINFEQQNPYFTLENSPFYIVNENKTWEAVMDEKGIALPRIAGVSSFGFGGSNAHIILEEFSNTLISDKTDSSFIIVLSAKTEERLKAYAKLMAGGIGTLSLHDIAYTLQVGRDVMDYRLAFVAESVQDAVDKLEAYSEGSKTGIFTGEGKTNKAVESLLEGELGETYLISIYEKGDLTKIAQLWTQGISVNWTRFYTNTPPQRLSLPTYPFAKVRHWIAEKVRAESTAVPTEIKGEVLEFGNGNEEEKMIGFLKAMISKETKIPVENLDEDEEVQNFGLDSMIVNKLSLEMEKIIGKADPSLYFSSKTIRELAKNVTEKYGEHFSGKTSVPSKQLNKSIAASAKMKTENRDIAIIGMSGKYPQSEDLNAFYENLKNGLDCIQEIPKDRWDYEKYYNNGSSKPGQMKSKWGGFISDANSFDNEHFNISYKEALMMHPEERLLLEYAWKCFENAGYNPLGWRKEEYRENVGVYIGASFHDYQHLVAEINVQSEKYFPFTSQIYSYANRLSYYFDLKGPSVALDTACSSSLYAIYDACSAIRSGNSDMALAGGVNLNLHPSKFQLLSAFNFMSTDGRCRAFADGGDGYVPGEGIGFILLKDLEKARKDGDNILSVIKGVSAGNDGKTNGFTVPNPKSQSQVIARALNDGNIHPESITLVECHGTGTALGDPIEITALTDTYKKFGAKNQYCAISSVKSNIGHLEAAAGIAQITKLVFQLQNKVLFPNVMHGVKMNTSIHFEDTPFYVQKTFSPWEENENNMPRRAGASSFGAGGTNVHLILEEFVNESKGSDPDSNEEFIFPFSAPSEEQLRSLLKNTLTFLSEVQNNPIYTLTNIAGTLQQGRAEFKNRICFIAKGSVKNLLALMNKMLAEKKTSNQAVGKTVNSNLLALMNQWLGSSSKNWLSFSYRKVALPGFTFNKNLIDLQAFHHAPKSELSLTPGDELRDIESVKVFILDSMTAILGPLPESFNNQADFDLYGIDSITGSQIHNRLAKRFQDIEDMALLEYSSVDKLAEYIFETFIKPRFSKNGKTETNKVKVSEESDEIGSIQNLGQNYKNKDTLELISIQQYLAAFAKTGALQLPQLETIEIRNGKSIELVTMGAGDPLFLMPPFNSTAIIWINQLLHFSKSHKVIVFHYPGIGNSDWIEDLKTFEDLAKITTEVIDVLLNKGSIHTRNVHMVGWSFGAFLVQKIAQLYPAYVKSLILLSTTTISWSSKEYKVSGEEFSVKTAQEFRDNVNLLPEFVRNMPEFELLRNAGMSEVFVVGTKNQAYIKNYFLMIARFKHVETAETIDCPTYLISGSEDVLMPAKYARQLHEKIKNSSYFEVEQGEHFMSLFNKDTINEKLQIWLTGATELRKADKLVN